MTDKPHLFSNDLIEPLNVVEGKFICVQCGKPGVVEPGNRPMDARYALGTCTGTHVGRQYLVREDAIYTEKKRRNHTK